MTSNHHPHHQVTQSHNQLTQPHHNQPQNQNQTSQAIQSLFSENELNDLRRFISKRQQLNCCNEYMVYCFYLVQSIGILTTSVGTSINLPSVVWCGIVLNMIASVLQIYEKLNDKQMKKLMKNIQLIRDNKYTDESSLVDMDIDSSGERSGSGGGERSGMSGERTASASGSELNTPLLH